MLDLDDVLVRLAAWLDRRKVPYMVIGGFAVTIWGEPRFTRDLDVTIAVETGNIERTIERLSNDFDSRVEDPHAFVAETRVLPMTVETVPVDLVFAALPYERDAVARALPVQIKGQTVRICTPEDLILHKIVSPRARDQEDIEGLFRHRGSELDHLYLGPRVRELSETLDDPGMLGRYDELKRRWRGET